MHLNRSGDIACQCWQDIPAHFPSVACDTFIIMPNHIHGILQIMDSICPDSVGAKDISPLQYQPYATNQRPRGTSKTIGSIVRGFKIGVTKWMRENIHIQNIRQRNYYEHIIRDEKELIRIQQYILENPLRWETDHGNPDAVNAKVNTKKNFEELGV
jgi:putative transposase